MKLRKEVVKVESGNFPQIRFIGNAVEVKIGPGSVAGTLFCHVTGNNALPEARALIDWNRVSRLQR